MAYFTIFNIIKRRIAMLHIKYFRLKVAISISETHGRKVTLTLLNSLETQQQCL